MATLTELKTHFSASLGDALLEANVAFKELTLEVKPENLQATLITLRDDATYPMNQMIDLTVVDYLTYGTSEWSTEETTGEGFSRAVNREITQHMPSNWTKPRFAVVYHLMSLPSNRRVRVKVFVEGDPPVIASVCDLWLAANWFEREAYDLFGVLFDGHPDLRRILTDYGFIGHPFRKDFPVSGHVEMRYDATEGRVIYRPVDIEPRVLVPKVIRDDNRYRQPEGEE